PSVRSTSVPVRPNRSRGAPMYSSTRTMSVGPAIPAGARPPTMRPTSPTRTGIRLDATPSTLPQTGAGRRCGASYAARQCRPMVLDGARPLYDRIGRGYTTTRRPDPRIAAAIGAALGDARTVINVGAGAGAYEPSERRIVAIEPSTAMIRQRP